MQKDAPGNRTEISYEADGQIKDVRRGKNKDHTEQRVMQQYEYNARGQIVGIVDGNQNKVSYDTDSWGRITGIGFADGVKDVMEISGYVINILSAVVAVEYIDYGFQKKYCGVKRWSAFIVGCVVYFLTVTVLNQAIQFEGVLGFCYGAVLIGYGVWALKGKIQDFLLAGLLWVLIAILGTYGIFSIMGLLTGKSLGELRSTVRHVLTIGILLDEAGIIVVLIQLYHRLGKYQREKIEEQYRREKEKERLEGLVDIYRVSREINHWRHDIQGEMEVLYRMQKNGKYAEVETYLEKLYSELRDYPELPQPTGKEGLDAALMKMIPKCREKGIHFRYVILGKPGRIDSIVLGNLMDNLLSNGLEACQKLVDTKGMDLVVRSQGEWLEICLENSIGESVLKDNEKLVSHKQEKERHGFGMESIGRIVEEYDGTYKYWEERKGEGNRFCQCIYLRYVQDH